MQYITIKELKSLAKKERKNNTLLKNHTESLDLIASKYNHRSWEALIDASVLILKDEKDMSTKTPELLLNKIIDNALYEMKLFKKMMYEADYRTLEHYLFTKFFTHLNTGKSIDTRNRDWLRMVCFLYRTKVDNYYKDEGWEDTAILEDFNLEKRFLYLISFNKLDNILNAINANENLIPEQLAYTFFETTLLAYKKPTSRDPNPEQEPHTSQEYAYLTLGFTLEFDCILNTIKILDDEKLSKNSIIAKMNNPDSFSVFYNNNFFIDKNNLVSQYLKLISDNDFILGKEDFNKHLEIISKII